MNGPTVTQMPTLCVPEKLNKQELVDQVIYLQKASLQQGQQLHALIDSYEAGDQAAILQQVKSLAEQRTKQRAKVH